MPFTTRSQVGSHQIHLGQAPFSGVHVRPFESTVEHPCGAKQVASEDPEVFGACLVKMVDMLTSDHSA